MILHRYVAWDVSLVGPAATRVGRSLEALCCGLSTAHGTEVPTSAYRRLPTTGGAQSIVTAFWAGF